MSQPVEVQSSVNKQLVVGRLPVAYDSKSRSSPAQERGVIGNTIFVGTF